ERYYATDNANVHRGVHLLSERATQAYEAARSRIRRFLNAAEDREIVFVRGTTEAINLVPQTYGRPLVRPGDAILTTPLYHHRPRASRDHRPLADALRGERGGASRGADRRRGRGGCRSLRAAPRSAHAPRRVRTLLQRPRHGASHCSHDRGRAPPGRPRPRR